MEQQVLVLLGYKKQLNQYGCLQLMFQDKITKRLLQ